MLDACQPGKERSAAYRTILLATPPHELL